MPVQSFESEEALAQWFDSEVFRAVGEETLFVHDKTQNQWFRYQWTRGNREIKFVGEHQGELPLVTQVYPEI